LKKTIENAPEHEDITNLPDIQTLVPPNIFGDPNKTAEIVPKALNQNTHHKKKVNPILNVAFI
jgi:hypothetical protein